MAIPATLQEAVDSIRADAERERLFTSSGSGYTRDGGGSVESLPAFVLRKDAEVNAAAVAAVDASGYFKLYLTKAAAQDDIATIPEGRVVEIVADETAGQTYTGHRTRYEKIGSVLVFRIDLSVLPYTKPEGGATTVGARLDDIYALTGLPTGVRETRYRNLRGILDAYMPAGLMPKICALKKLRTDFTEFAFYQPTDTTGTNWARLLFTNRFNTGLSGATRLLLMTIAKLYQSTQVAPLAENQTTGTEGQAPSASQGTAAATTRTGTWAASATVGGVPDIRFSTVTGDTVRYTFTAAERVAIRGYANTANGGIVRIVVMDAGVEISAGLYTVPDAGGGARLINLALTTGLQYLTLAVGLDPARTYTVDITVDATNPVGGRSYEGGLRLYNPAISNAVEGRQGIFGLNTIAGQSLPAAFYSGARVARAFTGTRVAWRYGGTTNTGIVDARVYTTAGVEIAAGFYRIVGNQIDTFTAGGALVTQQLVAEGLPMASYVLVITNKNTKNAASTGFRVYDAGLVQYNEAIGGTVGTDEFDDMGVPSNYQGTIPAGTLLMGTGNLEQAIKVRRTTDAPGTEEFVGGTHGFESPLTGLSFELDGVAINYAGALANASFFGSSLKVGFTTQLRFPTGAIQEWATSTFLMRLSPAGYSVEVTRAVTASAVVYDDYTGMFVVPNTQAGVASLGVDGGFLNWAIDGENNRTFTAYNNSVVDLAEPCVGAAVWSRNFAVYGRQLDFRQTRQRYELLDLTTNQALSFVQDRPDGSTKYYNRAFKYGANGRTLQIGDTNKHVNLYRAVKGGGFGQILAGH